MLANTPAMLECHYGVPMTGGVLNTINTRLDAAIIAFQLDHGEAKVLIVDREFSKVVEGGARASPRRSRSSSTTTIRSIPAPASGSARSNTRRSSRRAIRTSPGRCRATSGTPSRSTTPRAPPAIRRAWSITIAARYLLAIGNVLTCGDGPASGLSVDAADVPLQRLVLPVDAVGGGRHACLPARGARQGDVRRDRRRTRSRICAARRS